jgi:hypothetical protein
MTPGSSNGNTGKAPDYPQTRLAFRVWRFDQQRLALRSLNAGNGRRSWLAAALSDPAGEWPRDAPLLARCPKAGSGHQVPARECACGIYAATSLEVIDGYLTVDAPVLGVVDLGGTVIPATQGYRASHARVAAILILDQILTLHPGTLRTLAAAYRVPALIPHSEDAEDYRAFVQGTVDLDDELRRLTRGENNP